MRDHFPQFEEANAIVLGVSPDPVDVLNEWRQEENLPYPLLSDADHEVAETYGVWGQVEFSGRKFTAVQRSHFVIDAEGRFEDVQYKVGPQESVERAAAVVK